MENSRFYAIPSVGEPPHVYTCLFAVGCCDYICKVSQSPLFFEAESKLADLLKGKEQLLQRELERTQSVDCFCQRILHFISKLVPSSQVKGDSHPPSSFFKRILDEVKEIGWDIVSKVDSTLSFIEVSLIDDHTRTVIIRFDLDSHFPRTAPKVTSNVPTPVAFEWDPQSSRLSDIVSQHRSAIQAFQPFWAQLEDLDRNSFVIEPREPSLACTMRRIVLTGMVQLQLEVNPRRPMGIPTRVSFIGAEMQSRELREKFMARSREWRLERSLRENIEDLLEITLPKPDDDTIAETDFDCGICYCERLGAELPEVVCEKCSKKFHRSCLLEWLRTRPNAEQSFQVVFGTCPFCDAPIQCNTVELR